MFVLVSFDPILKNKNVVFTSSYKDHLQKICAEFNQIIDGIPVSSLPEQIVIADKVFIKDENFCCYKGHDLRISFAVNSWLAIYEVPNV